MIDVVFVAVITGIIVDAFVAVAVVVDVRIELGI